MKNRIEILLLCLICQFCSGQINSRKSVHGQVVNDLMVIDNGYVFNINSKTRTFISAQGFFDILGKPKDTLLISSLAFKSKKIILTETNLSYPLLIVPLELFENRLDEVVVLKKKEVIPISANTQHIVDTDFFDDTYSSAKNSAMPPDGTIKYGVNFVRIYKEVLKVVIKKKPKKTDTADNLDFTTVTLKRMKQSFFVNTLQLKDSEIGLFLAFCENDSESKNNILKPESEFHLIEFLLTKNQEFKRMTTFEK